MDKLVGKLVAQLDSQGIRNNTLIIFVGDNGTGKGTKSMMGDKVVIGGKGTTTAAGMHVPLIVNLPGKVIAGKVHSNLVDSTDFVPTLLDAAGISSSEKKLDGLSFLPHALGKEAKSRDWVYSWYSPRQGNDTKVQEFAFNHESKLYRTGEFYDLKADPEQKKPKVVKSLEGKAAMDAKLLQGALEQYANARPKELDLINGIDNAKKKNKKNKEN
jgi:arylsulfatase A